MKNSEISNKGRGVSYHIWGFMKELGIGGTTLNLYAIIYSFTVCDGGMYFGTKAYLASALSVCKRTVERCVKLLKEKGLVEECTVGARHGIRAIIKNEGSDPAKSEAESLDKIGEIDRISLENEAARRLTEEEKAVLEEERLLSAKKEGVAPDPWEANRDDIDLALGRIRRHTVTPKYTVLPLGLNARVMLTDEQYQRLILIGGDQIADIYIQRLDDMLSDPKSYNKSPHSHYKTIKSWMEEDLRT